MLTRLHSAAKRVREGRTGTLAAIATAFVLGGGRPAFARTRSYVPPDLEQAFRRERFDSERLASLGIKVDSVITKDFLFSEKKHQVSEVQQEIYDYDDEVEDADQGRVLGLAVFAGVSILGGNLALQGARKVEKWMKQRDELERLKEIELTGTYVNPFAGDVDEIVDPITGQKKKIEKKPEKEGDDEGPPPPPDDDDTFTDDDKPSASGADKPKKGGPGDAPGGAGKQDSKSSGKEGGDGIDILKDLL